MFAHSLIQMLALAATMTAARTDVPVPAGLRSLRPHQVVEQIMARREALSLSDEQFARLDDLTIAIRGEKHGFIHRGGKPHRTRHVPMISRQEAFDRATAVLTPDQQARLGWLFPGAPIASTRVQRVRGAPGKP